MAQMPFQLRTHPDVAIDAVIRFREDAYGYTLNLSPLVMTTNLWKQDGVWVLCNVWVHPRFRGLKLTHRMMTALFDWMARTGNATVFFPVKDANMPFWNWMAEYYNIVRKGEWVHIRRAACL